jgi:3-oxoacyl-[acyl-carrier protein] reductase
MKLLTEKVALVTGASRGIGRAIAEIYAKNGAHVAFTYLHSEEKAKQIEADLLAFGVKAKAYKSDAGSFGEAETLVAEVIKDFGQIDILVNNAGITKDNLLLRMSEQQWDEVIQANLKSVFNLTKCAVKEMLLKRSGSIINLTSVVGISGNAGQANYAASKAGVIGFTKSIAAEIGSRSVRCNAIAPGFIKTDMTDKLNEEQQKALMKTIPLNRLGTATEVAETALFLASDLSTYITGQVISVCGGMSR